MAENKKNKKVGPFMKKAFDTVLPYLDVRNDLEQVGNIYGVSEEDRNNSRLNHVITGEKRPLSHSATETAAWLGANVVPEVVSGAAKGIKSFKAVNRAAENADAFNLLNNGIQNVDDYRVINEIRKAGNAVNDAGVNAAESVKKGKIIQNSAKRAWKENSSAAQKILDDAKDAAMLNEVIERAEPERAKKLSKIIDYVELKENEMPYEDWLKLNEKYFDRGGEFYNSIAKETFDNANKAVAAEKGEKASLAAEAINKALASGHDVNESADTIKDPKSLYNKINPVGSVDSRLFKQGFNTLLNFFDVGTMADEWPMEKVDQLVKDANKDGFFDQKAIDSMTDVEKVKFIKKLAKGKFGSKKAQELKENYANLTNNNEDKK